MNEVHHGRVEALSHATAIWSATLLLDLGNVRQWSEDLSADQIRAILGQVPHDSRVNVSRILTAVAAGEGATIKSQAHRLKGMAANIGALRLAKLAHTLEYGAVGDVEVSDACAALPVVLSDTLAAIEALKNGI